MTTMVTPTPTSKSAAAPSTTRSPPRRLCSAASFSGYWLTLTFDT